MRDGIRSPGNAVLAGELAKLEGRALRGGHTRAQAIKIANKTAAQVTPLTRTAVRDWIDGTAPPRDFDQLWALVAVLREWAGAPAETTKQGRDARVAAQRRWKDLWEHAQRGEESVNEPPPQRGAGRLGALIADADPIGYLEIHPAIEASHPPDDSQTDPLPAYVEREHDHRLSKERARHSSAADWWCWLRIRPPARPGRYGRPSGSCPQGGECGGLPIEPPS
ncbi:hypothetical protein [Streptomyces sp. NPDC007205]|uniref:hypothetical protein n=1 Tax=Streptomyces sp. NPDC007205 TaxID=3154316 RepID=UPI00340B18C9